MFGEFILIGGGILISALTSKGLEAKGKVGTATALEATTKTGLIIIAAVKVNNLFKEFLDL